MNGFFGSTSNGAPVPPSPQGLPVLRALQAARSNESEQLFDGALFKGQSATLKTEQDLFDRV